MVAPYTYVPRIFTTIKLPQTKQFCKENESGLTYRHAPESVTSDVALLEISLRVTYRYAFVSTSRKGRHNVIHAMV